MANSSLVYGFHDLEQLKSVSIQQIGTTETMERIRLWQAEINRVFDSIFSSFTVRDERWNANPIMKYHLPTAATSQYGDEFMVAKPTIEEGAVTVGLPLWRYEMAFGFSAEALAKVTVDQYSRALMRIERGDRQTAIRQFLWALFNDTNYTFASTEDALPDIPVKAGANGDAEKYILRSELPPATAQHYLAQAAAISDTADPFPAIKELLTSYSGTNVGDLIVTFVGDATNTANIIDLAGFQRVDRTRFTRWGDTVSLVDPGADRYIGMGEEVLGEHEAGIIVVRWKRLPDNYLLSFNLDAPSPVGIREDMAASLRGLFNINAIEQSGNLLLSRYRRKIGFAPVNRTGFCINRIGNASYAIPPTIVQPG